MENYCEKFIGRLILRDLLATDRTQLANERTLLAYVRTALTLFIAGVSFIQFFGYALIVYTGWLFIPLGFIVGAVGAKRYYRFKRPLDRLRKENFPDDGKADYDI